jgi:putative transposase
MKRTYKRKLKLNISQQVKVDRAIGICRLVYNIALEIQKYSHLGGLGYVDKYALSGQLPDLKKGFPWVAEVPAQSLQGVLDRLDWAYKRFFNNKYEGASPPNFISKRGAFSIPYKQGIKLHPGYKIQLPKLGALKMFKDAPIVGIIKTATLKKEARGYFIYVVCEVDNWNYISHDNQAVGIDLGLTHFAALSDGRYIKNPKFRKKSGRDLARIQKAMHRSSYMSGRWLKRRDLLRKKHWDIANKHNDFIHKTTTCIAREFGKVCVEDLNISKIGKESRECLTAGWGLFVETLSYKTNVVKVSPEFTSQQCFKCGNISKDNRKSQAEFECVMCGHTDNADTNAAKNIKSRGTALSR